MYEFCLSGARPVPKGSMNAMVNRATGKAFVYPQNSAALKELGKLIAAEVRPTAPIEAAVELNCVFTYKRPKSHYNADGSLTDAAPKKWAVTNSTTGDLDKLLRAIGDALTECDWWKDDVLVARSLCEKVWGDDDSIRVWVSPLPN